MQRLILILLAGVMIPLVTSADSPAPEPFQAFHPGALWPDTNGTHINAHGGGILHHEGAYYWFGEHKIEGVWGNQAWVGVHVYASVDLYNWYDMGIALPVVHDDDEHDLAAGCILERPKVIHNPRTGKFVMWFHLERKGEGYGSALTGVAIADQVTGPYTYLGSLRPNAGVWPKNIEPHQKEIRTLALTHEFDGGSLPADPDELNLVARDFAKGQMARDQTLFVDDDGTAYHIYSSEENSTLHISRLNDDFTAPAGEYVRVFPGRFMEAPALFKHDDKYYLIASGCTGWFPNPGRSAVAESIWGPWTELGNPFLGDMADTSFDSQPTYVLPIPNRDGAFIYLGDRWRPENAIDGRYVWLPIQFENGKPRIRWMDTWDLSFFDRDDHRN